MLIASSLQSHGNGHVRLRNGVHRAGDNGRLQRDPGNQLQGLGSP